MLERLQIKNFAIIEEIVMNFHPRLNVITGETGAGKSILLGALSSILGGQASGDLVRTGAELCTLEGYFTFACTDRANSRLANLGVRTEERTLVLRREILPSGQSRAFANNKRLPLKRLKTIGQTLVDLHGQHEHQSLLNVDRHADFLDEYGGFADQATMVADLYRRTRVALAERDRLITERALLKREDELRRFQLDEIGSLNPDLGEENRLEHELSILENAQLLVDTAGALFELLYQAEGSVMEQLGNARRQLDQMASADANLAVQARALEEIVYAIEDLATWLRDYGSRLEIRPERSDTVRSRLEDLRELKRKYGGSLETVLAHLAGLKKQAVRWNKIEGEIERLSAEQERLAAEFASACQILSEERQRSAGPLAQAVEQGLTALDMLQTAFQVKLTSAVDPEGLVEIHGERHYADERGMEVVEFFISANPGEPPRPLARIASGGEISRVMMVLKEIIAEKDTVSSLVFDEIDTGISGRVAAALGRKLDALSASHQVIVITHLPQIASLAHRHFSVRKRSLGDRTRTQVIRLDNEQRIDELAYLLTGDEISPTAKRHAEELLRHAKI